MAGAGVTQTPLPLDHGPPGHPQQLAQARLGQPDLGAQREHPLPEGIVGLSIRRGLHRRSPFRATLWSAPLRSDEKRPVSSWTVTSPGSIRGLKLSGASPGGSTPFGALGPARRSQSTAAFILLYDSRFSGEPRGFGEQGRPLNAPVTEACSPVLEKEPGGNRDEN